MKNTRSILAALLVTLSLASCSKSYTCHCIYKTDGTTDHESDTSISEGKKEKSAAACDQMDSSTTLTLNGSSSVSTTECSLTD